MHVSTKDSIFYRKINLRGRRERGERGWMEGSKV